jgi:hypothetical protein
VCNVGRAVRLGQQLRYHLHGELSDAGRACQKCSLIIMTTAAPAQARATCKVPGTVTSHKHDLQPARNQIECVAYLVMAWRSRSAAPEEVPPFELVILGDFR